MSRLRLESAAALAGGHCWVERRLFELLGAWSVDAPTAAATLVLDRHAQHAAWRADQWWDRLPILAGVDRAALVMPPRPWATVGDVGPDPPAPVVAGRDSADLATADQATSDLPGAGADGIARLAVAYRVLLPRLAVAYARHALATTPVADGPVRRTLGHVRPDVAADWAEGEAVLQGLLDGAAAIEVAATSVAAAECRFVT